MTVNRVDNATKRILNAVVGGETWEYGLKMALAYDRNLKHEDLLIAQEQAVILFRFSNAGLITIK